MSKKITVILIAAIIAVCLITGVAFAVWSKLDQDQIFRFSASDLELNISSDQLKVDATKLTPENPVNASFVIEVVGEKSTVSFELASLTYNGGENGVFIPVPDGVVEVVLPKRIYGIGGDSIKNFECNITLRFNTAIDVEDIDPYYMNKQFKFTITAKAATYVIPTQYSITYHNVGSDVINDNITTYSVETNYAFVDAIRPGYEFQGWYLDNNFTQPIKELKQDSIVNNISIFAKWSSPIDYTITYNDNFGVPNDNATVYNIETDTFVLNDLVKDGYEFLGWFDAADGGNKISEITKGSHGDLTLYARWNTVTFNITYNDALNAPNENSVTYTIETPTITLKNLVKDGYEFLGWFDAPDGGNQVTEITQGEYGDKLLHARWAAVGYTIEYVDSHNAANNNPTGYDTETAVILFDLTKDGYSFLGWYDAEVDGNKITEIPVGSTGNKVFYAYWSDPIKYNIEYRDVLSADNSVNTVLEYTVETPTFAIAPLTSDGYTFLGWFDQETGGNQISEITIGSFGNITLYAQWLAITYTIDYQNVFDADNTTNVKQYDINTAVTFNDITRSGYTFLGWFDAADGGNKITGLDIGTFGDKIVYAQWSAETYSVTYNGLNGADNTLNATTNYTIETPTIILNDIALNGYNFLGWYDAEIDGNKVTEIALGSTGDKVLYARWELIRYTITYEGLEGADNSYHPTSYTVNDNVKFSIIIRPGYDLIGWFDAPSGGNQITEIPRGSTGNVTVYAQWRAIV